MHLPEPCDFLGKRVPGEQKIALSLDRSKDWRYCLHDGKPLGDHVCTCNGCGSRCSGYAADGHRPAPPEPLGTVWACGVTAVQQRRHTLLPKTLASLAAAGFPRPILFVDGVDHGEAARWEAQFNLPVTSRFPTIRTYGNFMLGLWELYLRQPHADRYAMFQDDLLASAGTRRYLDTCHYPDKGYWNLYTFPENQELAPRTRHGGTADGWYRSNQLGKGAVGLVFSREAVQLLLTSAHSIDRPTNAERGHKAIDGGIVSAFKKAGWSEWVHSPSLIQHVGERSTMGNGPHASAESWRGESFDARTLSTAGTR